MNGCSDDIEAALRAVTPKAEIQGEVAARHCKPWPPTKGRQTAAVMAFEPPLRLFVPEGRSLREVLALPMSTQELTSGVGLGCPDKPLPR